LLKTSGNWIFYWFFLKCLWVCRGFVGMNFSCSLSKLHIRWIGFTKLFSQVLVRARIFGGLCLRLYIGSSICRFSSPKAVIVLGSSNALQMLKFCEVFRWPHNSWGFCEILEISMCKCNVCADFNHSGQCCVF